MSTFPGLPSRRPTARSRVRFAATVLAVSLAAALSSCTVVTGIDSGTSATTGSLATDSVPVSPESALSVLDTLPTKGKAPATGYDRVDGFGTAWFDVDRNGCDTRNDILARDLTDTVLRGPCTVLTGSIVDPYANVSIDFVRGNDTSTLVQIDHIVALSNAWQTGAQQLSETARIALANDPLNLLAVDGSTNSSKGAGDTATWLPPSKPFRCEYVARQISVKAAYTLWVTPAERDAMVRVLSSCPEQPAYLSALASTAPPAESPTPPPAESPATPLTVHPGAFCADVGAQGQTESGTAMTCSSTANDPRARWRSPN